MIIRINKITNNDKLNGTNNGGIKYIGTTNNDITTMVNEMVLK